MTLTSTLGHDCDVLVTFSFYASNSHHVTGGVIMLMLTINLLLCDILAHDAVMENCFRTPFFFFVSKGSAASEVHKQMGIIGYFFDQTK